MTDHQIPDIGFVLQPARRHRLRFELIVIRYDATATLARDIAFNGTIYHRGDTVTSALDWTAYNVGYEYDFIARPRAAVGLLLELKGTEVRQSLASAVVEESRRTSVPAPGVGVAARGRVWPRVTVSGEFRGFVIPDSQNGHYGGRYIDVNGSATFDLARHVGARAGVRWLNIRHLGEADTARLSLPGIYAGLVVTAQ